MNPNFFSVYELEGDLPQDWKLTINVRSYSEGGINHSLIGSTVIDLEDRYLCDNRNRELLKYKALYQRYTEELAQLNNKEEEEDKDADMKEILQEKLNKIESILLNDLKQLQIPVESRPLYNPDKKVAQGMIEMFCQVLTKDEAKKIKIEKIEPPPPQDFECRLIIWETREIPAQDPVNFRYLFCRNILSQFT